MMSLRFCVELECVKSSHSASKEAGKRVREKKEIAIITMIQPVYSIERSTTDEIRPLILYTRSEAKDSPGGSRKYLDIAVLNSG